MSGSNFKIPPGGTPNRYDGKPNPVNVHLGRLSAKEALALWRYVRNVTVGNRTEEDAEWREQLEGAVDNAVENLPLVDLPHAREVYTTFADSPVPRDRWDIGIFIGYLTAADHEAGMSLWERLVRDPDAEVREMAYETLEHSTDTDDTNKLEALLQRHGLTWEDLAHLTAAYIEAEQFQAFAPLPPPNPEVYNMSPDLGELALQRAMERTDDPS